MDQGAFEGLLNGFRERCGAENNLPDLTVTPGRMDAPIVVMVHGIGGNARHWTDPLSLNPDDTWLFDLNAHPSGSGIASSPPYQAGSLVSWGQFLQNEQITAITWSQGQPNDLLEYAVRELVAVLTGVEQQIFAPYANDVAASGGATPPLILLCHSRGGLVTRAALKQLGGAGVPHLAKVITLCTPHHGSYMPRLAADYNSGLSDTVDFGGIGHNLPGPIRMAIGGLDDLLSGLANRVREAMLHSFGTLSQGPGFAELEPDSPTLRALTQDEQPISGVQYHAFGGSNPTFVTFYLCAAGRAFPLVSTMSAFLVEQIARIPGIAERFGRLEELDEGDSAVGLTSSHWPDAFGAPHQVAHVNHMQALIAPALQEAVRDIMRA